MKTLLSAAVCITGLIVAATGGAYPSGRLWVYRHRQSGSVSPGHGRQGAGAQAAPRRIVVA